MSSGPMARIRRLSYVTAAVTYLLVTVGGLVRATESGLGCGDDWPRCSGRVVPAGDHHTWIEFTHRAIAAVVIVLTVALATTAWRHARDRTDVHRPALATVPLVLFQAVLGAIVVVLELHAASVVAHLLLAMTLFAVVLSVAVHATLGPRPESPVDERAVLATAIVALGVLATMALGSYVSGREAGLAFRDWPLFDGAMLPSGRGELGVLHGTHRILAAASGLSIAGLLAFLRARGADLRVRRLVLAAGLMFGLQIFVGAANVWTELSSVTRTAHLAVAAAVWALLTTAALVARRAPATAYAAPARSRPDPQPRPAWIGRAGVYFRLTKPRVIELLLVTTVPAMVLAHGGFPPVTLVLAVLFGGALAAGGANTINCYIDRDRDAEMHRTHGRPLPSGDVDPRNALVFGIVLEIAAFGVLWITANLLAASLAVAATLFYVFVYSIWLKPRTAQNIVIGGAAGAVPVLVGWAAVTSGIGSPAWVLFAIIFLWTPPHFWALAMRYRDDYAAAGVPMLPVVAGEDATTRQILWYSVIVVAATLVLVPVASMGLLYGTVALGMGGAFVWKALQLRRHTSTGSAIRLFSFSNAYLALLFAAVALDVIVARPI